MRLGAYLGCFQAMVFCFPFALLASDPAPADPPGSLILRDGRVLHHVRTLSDEGASLVVSADEGVIKVDKADLPVAAGTAARPAAADKAGPELVMRPFDPDQAPAGPLQEPAPRKPDARRDGQAAPRARPGPDAVFNGCTIASFEARPFQSALGSAQVVIRNGTDQPVVLRPGDLTCVDISGARHPGRSIVADGFPPSVRRRAVVPAQGETHDIVLFTAAALEISSIQWTR